MYAYRYMHPPGHAQAQQREKGAGRERPPGNPNPKSIGLKCRPLVDDRPRP